MERRLEMEKQHWREIVKFPERQWPEKLYTDRVVCVWSQEPAMRQFPSGEKVSDNKRLVWPLGFEKVSRLEVAPQR